MTENQGDYKTFADATPTPAPQKDVTYEAIIEEKIKKEFKFYVIAIWFTMGLMILGIALLFLDAFSLSNILKYSYIVFWIAALILPIIGLYAYYTRNARLTEKFLYALLCLEIVCIALTIFATNFWNIVFIVAFAYLLYGTWRLTKIYHDLEKHRLTAPVLGGAVGNITQP